MIYANTWINIKTLSWEKFNYKTVWFPSYEVLEKVINKNNLWC